MFELKPPHRLPSYINVKLPIVFTAGSIEMGKAEFWQDRLAKEFEDHDVIFANPRREDWDSSWTQDPTPGTKFHEQVEWELDHIELADIVIFYFDPKTQSPITLLELGLCLSAKKNVIVCCPDGYFRKGNVVITCALYGVEILNSFDEMVTELKESLLFTY